jgi:hypothetical protein
VGGRRDGDLVRLFALDSMKIKVNLGAVFKTKWHEYAVRFVIGGGITVAAGLIADRFGPVIGGLFLAFPAIFPASATLIEKHQTESKERAGLQAGRRARLAVALDAIGAAMGGIGMIAFAVLVWRLLPHHTTWLVLTFVVISWFTVSVVAWKIDDAL